MRRAVQDDAGCGVDAEFFEEFAAEAGALVLAVFYLSAGKLPLEGVEPVAAALADEYVTRTGQ